MKLPELQTISSDQKFDMDCAFLFAMGFEDRALAIPKYVSGISAVKISIGIKYIISKGENKESEAKELFSSSAIPFKQIDYSSEEAHRFEDKLRCFCNDHLNNTHEIIIDISAMSKFLILVTIVVLLRQNKRVRIVYASAERYAPTQEEYKRVDSKEGSIITAFAGQPSTGISSILRSVCLSSTRMQGQPVCAVAFTSFNEELIRHSIGTLTPHRLIIINGIPPNVDLEWRAKATQKIHQKLIDEYSDGNPVSDDNGLLLRSTSTFDYRETLEQLLIIRDTHGVYERIIYFATGSKLQTVALALLKTAFTDVHIECPTPESYFFRDYSGGVGDLFNFVIDESDIMELRDRPV